MEGTFEDAVVGTILFIRSVSERELAEFIVHQTDAIEGLTKNNKSFIKVYKDLQNKKLTE